MLERLSMRHLRTLRILNETQNMCDTARLVNRSQPAVSLQIKDLEQIVGFQIIYHQRGAIFFTEQGEKFARAAQKFEQQLASSIDILQTDSTPGVRVGITQDLYAACGRLRQKLVENGVILVPMNSLEILQGCADRSLDLGVAKTGAPLPHATKTWDQKLNWAGCVPEFPRDTNIELVLLAEGCHFHELALRGFEDAAPDAVSLSICDSWNEIAQQLKGGGVTIVPSGWRAQLGGWPNTDQSPKLPACTLNLLTTPNSSKAVEWAASQLTTLVSSALEGGQTLSDNTWKANGIRLF